MECVRIEYTVRNKCKISKCNDRGGPDLFVEAAVRATAVQGLSCYWRLGRNRVVYPFLSSLSSTNWRANFFRKKQRFP